ncbi:MAG: hypothetical protein K0R05_3631 [Anaerocolumna sp.]|jgi:ribosomal protein S18 acetylase RimI-like enzyme|nr:hypothetical protein [Anaerocolumna sp.]
MKEEAFIKVKESLGNYLHNSLEYTEFDDIADYELLIETEELILISGFNCEADSRHYHWAAVSPQRVIEAIGEERNFYMEFIPEEWVDTFTQAGYIVRDKFRDYLKEDLLDINNEHSHAEFLQVEDSLKAAEVTMSCKGQSRGFTGQTQGWIEEWLTKTEDIVHKEIVIERNEQKEIVGVCFTGVYGINSQKGPVAWIREVAVNPDYQNKGIGRRLIKQALSHGKSHGAVRAFLAADECNVNAIHLYKSLGFQPDADTQIDIMRE